MKRYWPVALGLIYLFYRLSFTAAGANGFLFVAVFLAELFGLLRLIAVLSLTGRRIPVTTDPAIVESPDASIIVLITDEPESEVRSTVLSARLVRGKKDLVVIDQRDRLDVMQLCQRLDVRRVAGGGDRRLGKLVNSAMGVSTTAYWLIVPGDVVLLPDVLQVTAVAMRDERVAVVRPRVERTNARSSEDYGGYGQDWVRDEHVTAVFDESDAVMPWWPGVSLVRRGALLDIDGVATVDGGFTLETGARLQSRGWHVEDLPVVVGRRLAVRTDRRLLHRWSRDLYEQLSMLERPDSPIVRDYVSGLRQRAYLFVDFYLAASLQKTVLLVALLFSAVTGALPASGSAPLLALLFTAWHASSIWARWHALRKGFAPWFSSDLRLLTTNAVVGWASRVRRPLNNDLVDPAPGESQRRVLMNVLPVVFGLAALVSGLSLFGQDNTQFEVGVIVAFCLLVAATAIDARLALRERQGRRSFRAQEELEVRASLTSLAVVGVSVSGIDLLSAQRMVPGSRVRVSFALPRVDQEPQEMNVFTTVKRVDETAAGWRAYAQFHLLSANEMDRLLEYVAVISGVSSLRTAAEPGVQAAGSAIEASAFEVAEDD